MGVSSKSSCTVPKGAPVSPHDPSISLYGVPSLKQVLRNFQMSQFNSTSAKKVPGVSTGVSAGEKSSGLI